MNFPLDRIADILGVKSSSRSTITTLSTDSRSLLEPQTTLFFALKTSTGDGHRYIADMYRRGVRAFVVEYVPEVMSNVHDAEFLVVPDVLAALQSLGGYVRGLVDIPVVAITGSRGKTVVKELVYTALLKAGRNVVRSPRSWNSQIGVPLSLWQLQPDTEVAIFEAGIDRPGQMAISASLIRPTIGVMTAITDEHSVGFADMAEKEAEKRLLLSACDTVIESSDNREAAARILLALGENPALLDGIDEVSTRLDVHESVNSSLMIYDEFTADMGSLGGALDFMSRRKTASRRNTLILGDLLHRAGEDVRVMYRAVSRLLDLAGIDRLIGIGSEICASSSEFNPLIESSFFKNVEEFIAASADLTFNSELILVKGARDNGFDEVKRALETPRHQSIMEINLDAVIANFNAFRSLLMPQTGIVAMVKASGYGAGALELAKTLQAHGASYLAVAVVEEGVALRRAGITMPVMVLNPVTTNYHALFSYGLEPTVFSIRELDMLVNEASRHGLKDYPVHVKLDTGMHRLGFVEDEISALSEVLIKENSIKVASVFSHLATADCLDQDEYTDSQFEHFDKMTAMLAAKLPYKFKRHILNTAGIMRYSHRQYDMVRLGIGLYGLSPLPPESTFMELRPVARLVTTIIAIHRWPNSSTIGYSRRGILSRDSIVATIPIGYADGIDRRLGCGKASFVVNGRLCPTVGNICMDLCMIDVTEANAKVGDSVEIFGQSAPIENIASALETISYEVLTSVSPRIHRIYYRE